MIQHAIVPVTKLLPIIDNFEQQNNILPTDSSADRVRAFINELRQELWCYVEFPYVDKVYRDSYYTYFASKLDTISRDCLRISFFSLEITDDDFRLPEGHLKLQDNYLGFTVLRPLRKGNPGRSMLAPKAFKTYNFLCELVCLETSIGGVKMQCYAFPWTSQDTESMTCAESSLWSVMEYYGNKYPERTPVLPSEIHHAFERPTRVIPSEGLTIAEIATALSRFGFGTCLYNSETPEFESYLRYYIESGIPVILGLEGTIGGHAVVSIGHEVMECSLVEKEIDTLSASNPSPEIFQIIDTACIKRHLVQIDDNFPPYRLAEFAQPCGYYGDTMFSDMKITHFVVPLHKRIYLEARKAKTMFTRIINSPVFGWCTRSELKVKQIIQRIFITTGNSYKNYALKSDMHDDLKTIIQSMNMPRFIWVAELSTKDIYLKSRSSGLILLDATGSEDMSSAKLIMYPGYLKILDPSGDFKVEFSDFTTYKNNLRGEWSQWIC